MKISPNPIFSKRGIPPFSKGGEEGFSLQCLNNYDLLISKEFCPRGRLIGL
jgi:hypothetical protein